MYLIAWKIIHDVDSHQMQFHQNPVDNLNKFNVEESDRLTSFNITELPGVFAYTNINSA